MGEINNQKSEVEIRNIYDFVFLYLYSDFRTKLLRFCCK
jgi:hypothetical protein